MGGLKKPEIIVALDGMEVNGALYTARLLSSRVWGFKINDLLLEAGTRIIGLLKQHGNVFCDPKLFDIPATMAHSVEKLSRAGADMITVAGVNEMSSLIAAANQKKQSKIVAVGAPTSLEFCSRARVVDLVEKVLISGGDGIVASAKEAQIVRSNQGHQRLLIITSGVRPAWWQDAHDDQKRVSTPREAAEAGANFLVIGRPITSAPKPLDALERILAEL